MSSNREYSDFKVWCLRKGYCTQVQYDSINRLAYDSTTLDGQNDYRKARSEFKSAMIDHLNTYESEICQKIDDIIEDYPQGTIVYEALLGLYLEHSSKH